MYSVARSDGRLEDAKQFTQGWVARQFTQEFICPGDNEEGDRASPRATAIELFSAPASKHPPARRRGHFDPRLSTAAVFRDGGQRDHRPNRMRYLARCRI